MTISSWLKYVRSISGTRNRNSSSAAEIRRRRHSARRKAAITGFQTEAMESRLLLAGQSLTWDGEGIDDHWSNPQNWVGDQAPSPGDDLIFDSAVPGLSTYETTNDIPGFDVHSLTFINSGSFRIHGSAINFNNETASIINNGGTNIITADIAFSNGGTIEALSGNLDIQGEVQVGIDTVSFNVSENATIQVNGAVQGVGGIEKSGAGELRLAGPNGYSGETSIVEGNVVVRPGSSLGAMSGGTTVAPGSSLLLQTGSHEYISLGGTLQGSDSAVLAGGVMLSSSQAEILSTDSFSITGPLDGSFGVKLSAAPSALLKISGSGSYSGPTNVSGQGTVQLKSPGAISPNRLTVEQPSTVEIMADQVTGSIAGDGNLVLMASLTTGLDNSSTTFSGSISGSMSFIDSLIKTGSGTLTLTGNNTWRGATRVNSGTLKINGGMLNSLPDAMSVYVASSATLELNSSGGEKKIAVLEGSGQVLLNDFTVLEVGTDGSSSIFDGEIAGTGRLRKSGTGTLTLGGHNTYTGNTEIRDGIVQIQGMDGIPDTSTVDIYDGGTFSIAGSSETIGGLRGFGMGGQVNLNFNDLTINSAGSSGDNYFNGEIRGSGGLIKEGIGRQVLNGMNTYTGLTRILAGTLGLGTSEALSNVTDLVIDGGTLELAGGQETVNSVLLNSGRIEGYGSINTAFGFTARSGQVSGSSLNGMLVGNLGTGLSKESSGTVTLTGTSFTGTTTITEGTLVLDTDPSGDVIVSGGTLAAIGSVSHGVTLNGGILSVGRPGDTSAGFGLGSLSGTSGTLSLDLGADDVSIFGTGVSGVGGSLALANINLAVTINGAPASGHHFNVLRNVTSEPPLPEADRFHNLPEGATLLVDGVPLTITYSGGDGNDIELIYAVNSPPTAVSFVNNVSLVSENLDTQNPVRLADIVISDDGLGNNVVSLSGTDSDKFIVTGNSLFLKADAVLDYETQTSLSVTLTVTDPSLPSFSGVSTVLTLNIANINEAPVANDDAFSVDEDFDLDLTVGDLLGNDVDVDSDPNSLTVISVSDASHGIVTLNPDGSIRFVPNANFYGTAGFNYVLSDGELTSFAEVEVTVEAVNDSPEPVLTITPVSVPKGVPVLFDASDSSDVEGDSLTYTWEFGDGSVYTESAADASDGIYDGRTFYSYADEGNYPATLTVSDDNGGSAETSANVIVLPGTSEIIIAGFTVTNVIENGTSVSGDATLPLFGSVHLNGTVSNGHYSLSTSLGGTAFGEFSATTGSLTLNDSGLLFTGAFQLPALGSLSLSGSILDVDHFTITSPSFSKTIGGFDFSNVIATVNPSGLSISGTASLPVVGSLSLSGSILDVDHYTITSPSFSKTIGGFDFSNVIATVNPSGLSISGTASLPVLGSLSLSGTILDVDHYTITSTSFNKTIGGFDFSNVVATVNASGLSISGTASLPVVGSLALSGSILDVDHYSFSAPPIGNVSVGPFSLANTTITVSQLGLTVEGDVDLPLVGTVHVKGTIQDVDHYSFSTPTISDLSLLGFSLTDNIVSLSPAGIQFSGVASIPIISDVIGDVTLTGSITDADTFDIKAQLGDISLLDGLVEFNNPVLSLTPDALTFTTQTELLKIGTADFTYVLTADGDYSLTADVGMNVAGFQIDGVKLKYGADGLDVDFKMPVPNLPLPSSEGFSFHGKYTPDHWLLAGTYSGPVTVGPVVLTEITVTLTDVSLGVAAKATVANLEAFVNADMSATVYFDGRFEAFIDIHVLQIGSFQLGEALVTFGNTVPETRTDPNPFNHEFTPDRRFILTIDAFLGVSPGPRVEFGGFIDDTGNYEFHGKEDISLGPVHLAKGEFTLNKQDGLTFSAETHLGVADAHVSGTIDKDWNTNVTADLTILDSLHVSIDGYIHSNGDFHFDGHDEFGIAGVTLSETHFILDNTTGFEFFSDWNYGIFEATLHGTINGNGQIHFDGDGSGRIGSFDLGSVHVDADLDLIAEHYSVTVGANIHLIGTDFRLNKTLTFDAGNWSPFQLEGQRSLPGPLNTLFPGGVQWKVDQDGASFDGEFKSPFLAAGFMVHGEVRADGSLFVSGVANIPVIESVSLSGYANTNGTYSLSVDLGKVASGVSLGTLTLSNTGCRINATLPIVNLAATLSISGNELSGSVSTTKFKGISFGTITINSSGAKVTATLPIVSLTATLNISSTELSGSVSTTKFKGISFGSVTINSSGAKVTATLPIVNLTATLIISGTELSGSVTTTKFKGISFGTVTINSSGAKVTATLPIVNLTATLIISGTELSGSVTTTKFKGISFGTVTINSSGAKVTATLPIVNLTATLIISSTELSGSVSTTKFKGISFGTVTINSSGAKVTATLPIVNLTATLTISGTELSGSVTTTKFKGISFGTVTINSSGAEVTATLPIVNLTATLTVSSTELSGSVSTTKFKGISFGTVTINSSGAKVTATLPIVSLTATLIISGTELSGSVTTTKFKGISFGTVTINSSGAKVTATLPIVNLTATLIISGTELSGSVTTTKFKGISFGTVTINSSGAKVTATLPIVNLTATLTISSTELSGSVTTTKFKGISFGTVTINSSGAKVTATLPIVNLTATLIISSTELYGSVTTTRFKGISFGTVTINSSGAKVTATLPIVSLSATLTISGTELSGSVSGAVFGATFGSVLINSSGATVYATLPGVSGGFYLTIGSAGLSVNFSRDILGAKLYSITITKNGIAASGWAPYIGSINLSFGEYVNNSHPEGFGRFTIDGLNTGVSIFSIQELRLYSYGEFSVKAYSSILGTIWINGPDLNDLYTALSNRIPSPKIDGPRVGGVAGQVGNTISSGAKSLGKRINGTVAGGIVFFDANRNGQLDTYDPESSGGLLSEPWTFTNSTGEFLAEVPEEFDANHNGILDDADGQWAVAGGIFTATGIPIESVSTAPATWTMVTPVTSLVAEVMNRYGQSSQQAATHILRGLGLPAIDLSGFDGLQEVVNGNELGKSVYVAHAFITDTVTQLSAAISASGNLPPGDVTASVIRVMADRFVQSSLPIVFTDTSLAATLLQNVTDSLGVDIPSNVKSLTASIIAATNLELQGTLSLDGVAFINAAERVKLVAQGAATSAIAEAASGNTVPAVVLEQFTGAALADRIADAVLPPAVLVPETLVVEATSPSGASAEFHASANDIAGQQLNVTFDHASGSFFPLGDRSVRASAVDSFGNIGHADFIVRVKDSTEPRITLREIIVEATGADGAFVNLPANPAMDLVDTHPAIIYSLPDGIFPLGTTSLPVTATDFSGNTASETFLVTVVDTTAPRIHATADITVDADTVDGAFVSLPFVNATDDVDPSPQVSLDFESGRFPVGSTVVTATAVDRYGNVSTSTFSVIVRDVTAPSLEVPLPVILEATTSGGALSGQIPIIVTDNADPAPIVTLDDDVLPSGTTLVTATATDASGNSSSVTFSVTVVDTTAPEVLLPSELVVEATGPGGAVVDLAADAVSDLVDPNVVVTYDYASGLFPPGSTVVTATATDASGNSTVVTFTVTVLDTTAPNLPAQPDLIFVADGPDGRFVTLPEIVAFDAVDANPLVTIDAESGMFAIGTTLVTVTARDAAGNFSSTRFSVIVLDPSQTLVPSITEVGENRVEGQLIRFSGTAIDIATLVPTQNVDLAWRVYRNADNALVASASGVDLSEFEFVPDNDGEYRIELTVTDSFGHSSSTETLIVVENEPPQADFHYQRVNGQVMLFADATDVSTADTNTGFDYEWTVTRDGDLIASDSTLAPEFSFTPEGSGVYSVSLSVTDPDGGTTTVERIISVFVPVAQDLSAAIDEDGSFGGTLTATDTDGDSLTYSLVNAPSHGAVVINDDGSFSYVPNSDYFGSDSFTWIASDFHDSSSSATVSITIAAVNDAPVAEDQQVSGTEDHVVSGVLAASDIDSPHLFYSLNSEALNGTVEINSDGTFLYIPNPDFNGSDSFTFQVNDGDHISVGFVQVTIAAVSDTPIAIEEIVFGFEDAEISGHVNGTDADNDLLTYELLQAPIHGTVQLNADGSFHYVPFENYHGEDSFTFNATDGTLVSHPATLFISVSAINDSPVSFNDQFTVDEDSRLSGILNASDIDGDDLNFVLGVRPAHGTVSLGANGTFRYIPFADFYGSDTFSFAARDLETQSGYQTITVTVEPDNDAPKVSRPLSDLTVAEDSSDLIIHLKDSINDIDSENLTFTAQTSTGTPVFATVNGSDLVLHFLPNQSGTTEITVTADDGSLLAIDTFSVTVTPINDAPAATGNLPYVNVIQGAPGRQVSLGSLFSDVDDLVLTYSASSSNTAVAGVTINDLGALLNFSDTTFGTSIITITATDADGLSASLTVSVKVNEIVPPLGVDLSGGTLRITGTSGNDKVSVTLSGTQYLVTTSFSSPATLRFTTGSVQRILIQLQNGDDVATVSGAVTVPVTIDGGSGDDSLAGGSGSDTLLGGEGNDTLRGGRGNDVLDGGLGSDLADGGDGDDQVTGADGDDQLLGGTGNDILTGSAGNDRLDGGTGNDRYLFIADSPLGIETITDSTGVDTISFDHSASGVTLSLAATVSQTVNSFLTLTISAGSVIENAIGGSGNDLLTGNDAANTLTGLAGNDTLNGGAGNDTYAFNASAAAGSDVISDAAGTDLITFDGTSSAVSFSLALYGPQTVNSGLVLTMLPGTTIENLTGGDGDDILMGNAASNLLKGQGGNDTLSGAAGNDTYAFDADVVLGNDVISDTADTDTLNYAETSLDVNVNLAASGSQLVNPHQSLTILPGTLLENLIGGSGNDVLRGNSAVNAITGGGGNDWLAGANGNDTYFFNCNAVLGSDTIEEVANGGTDTVSFAGTTQRAVTISLASTTPQVVNDRLTLRLTSETSIENLIGTNGADQLTGNSLSNLLVGGSGNDRLDGGSGNDSLCGAAGDDILAGGADNDVYLMDADTALGTDTIIDAEESNDTLDYSATTTTGVTVNLSLTGIQNVASGHSLILAGSNIIENIIGGSQNDQLTGNNLANLLIGNAGNDILDGSAGNDIYTFDADINLGHDVISDVSGNDTLNFSQTTASGISLDLNVPEQTLNLRLALTINAGTVIEVVIGTAKDDIIRGNSAANILLGNAGNDLLEGREGNDVLIGGSGRDTLSGMIGEDLLIAGQTAYDQKLSLLLSLRDTWNGPQSFIERTEMLQDGTAADEVILTGRVTVLTDGKGQNDTLIGGADSDWYFRALDDAITDLLLNSELTSEL